MPSGSGEVADNDPSNPLTATEVEVPTIDAPMSLAERFAVPIVFTIFVVFRAADRVFMKMINNDLQAGGADTYNLMFANIIWPAAMQVITFCIILGYVIMQRLKGNKEYNCAFFKLNQPLASSTGPIPTYMLALFSLGDQLNAAMSAPESAYVSQPIQSVMTNFILIWMAIIAYFWISVRFKMVHYIGMFLVMLSVFIQFLPKIFQSNCDPATGLNITWVTENKEKFTCFSAYHSVAPPNASYHAPPDWDGGSYVSLNAGAMALFYIMFLISTLPAAVSNVYKQKVLQGVDADIFYVTWWSGWFQMFWGYICLPLIWIPLPGQPQLFIKDTPKAVVDTFRCMGGSAEVGESCASGTAPWIYVLLYFTFNATFNLCITWLIKRISAIWVQVATVVCLNLCNIFSTWHFIMGAGTEPMGPYDWAGAIVVSFALVVYNLQPEVTADGKEMLQQQAGSFVADGHAANVEKLSGTTPTGSFVKPGSFVG